MSLTGLAVTTSDGKNTVSTKLPSSMKKKKQNNFCINQTTRKLRFLSELLFENVENVFAVTEIDSFVVTQGQKKTKNVFEESF